MYAPPLVAWSIFGPPRFSGFVAIPVELGSGGALASGGAPRCSGTLDGVRGKLGRTATRAWRRNGSRSSTRGPVEIWLA